MQLEISPGQLYKTASGHLYHAGKICIVMVGLPARGKTHRAVSIARYLRWLGVKGQAFHLGDFRRKIADFDTMPDDYYDPDGESEHSELRAKVINAAFDEIWKFYAHGGQVALYDAINPTANVRRDIAKKCREHNVECLFVECLVTDENLLARNIGDVHATSPDYVGKNPTESVKHYLRKLEHRIAHYQPMFEPELPYIKVMNDGDRCMVNHGHLGYLLNRVLLFLLNSKHSRNSVFFARAGTTGHPNEKYKDDFDLSPEGCQYATTLANTLLGYISAKKLQFNEAQLDASDVRKLADTTIFSSAATSAHASIPGSTATSTHASAVPSAANSPSGSPKEPSVVVWTSARRKTMQTAEPLREAGCPVSHRSLLTLLNPGNVGSHREEEVEKSFPDDILAFRKDPYHHRYPRGESYQDVAIRLEPIMMEMERVESSLLIIAHETVLRVLYGYLMGSSVDVIPSLAFPANQIIELVPTGYGYKAQRIPLAGASSDGSVQLVGS